MSQRIRASQGDIVVVVPRWVIIIAGLSMLLMGLTISIFFLVVGFVTEGIFMSLTVLVAAPLYVLIAYMLWRFFWYLLILGSMIQFLLLSAATIGALRIAGNSYSVIRVAPGGPVFPAGDTLAVYGLVAFVLALGITGIIGYVLTFALDMAKPPAPVRKPRPPVKDYPPLDSPEWDDPKPSRRSRDLWRDDR